MRETKNNKIFACASWASLDILSLKVILSMQLKISHLVFQIRSSVTVCQKCRKATGIAVLTLAALKQIVQAFPQLEALYNKAIAYHK